MLHLDTVLPRKTVIFYTSRTTPSIMFGGSSASEKKNGICRSKVYLTYAHSPITVFSMNEEIGLYIMLELSPSKPSFTTAFPLDTFGLEYFALTHCPAGMTCTYTCSISPPYNDSEIYIDGFGKTTLQMNGQFSFNSSEDLSGTYIRGNNPIAVTCGAISNNITAEYISIAQLPPIDSFGLRYRIVLQKSDTGILRILNADGNTVITLLEYKYEPIASDITSDTPLTKKSTIRTVQTVNDPGEIKDIAIENSTAYDIEANKPIMMAYLPTSTGPSGSFPVVLISPADSVIEYVYTTTTTSSSYQACAEQQVPSAVIDGQRYFIPYIEIDGIYTTRWMRVELTSTVRLRFILFILV